MMGCFPLRAFAAPQIPSRRGAVSSKDLAGAQNDAAPGFEEPVRVFEVRWLE